MAKISINFPPVKKPTPAVRNWSEYQEAIFDFAEQGSGNAIIEAVAGSGKTSTIKECNRRVKGSKLFLAFNKDIVEELKQDGINARTFHSLCFGPAMQRVKAHNPSPDKLRSLVEHHFTGAEQKTYGHFSTRLVSYARQVGIGCIQEDTVDNWLDLVNHHEVEIEDPEGKIEDGIGFARKLLKLSNESNDLDFDDMLYWAVLFQLPLPKFDWIFVDEAQDTNPIQRAILKKISKPTTRLIAVGDPAQAIYGFRGADSESLSKIREEFEAITLPLSVSYRCPRRVIEHARQWVSHIQPAPNAPEGEIIDLGEKWNIEIFKPEDLVVCRTSRPIVSLAFKMLQNRMPVQILGRDLQEGLKATINKMRARGIDQLEKKLGAYAEREAKKANTPKEAAKAHGILDRVATIKVLIEGLTETNRTIPALLTLIDTLFVTGPGKTTLSTIHKSKGLESKRVIWINPFPGQWAMQDWQAQQERNLCYVATTRAIETLILVCEPRRK